MEFEAKLNTVRIGGSKSDKQLSNIKNNTKFCKSREEVIKFYNDCFKMVNKATYDAKRGTGPKILTAKQMRQRLLIVPAQVRADNTSKNLLNKIRQIIYSLYQEKKTIKKVYINIVNSIKLQNGMDTIFMNSKNSKTSDPHRLILNFANKNT